MRKNAAKTKWYKGNTHTHTNLSDGDVPPEQAVAWYKAHGYDFLALTDHNKLYTPPADGVPGLLLIAGEEVSDAAADKPIHVPAIGLKRHVEPQGGKNIAECLRRNSDAISAAGGLAQVAHPNFCWAFSTAEMAGLNGVHLLEIFNGHPAVNNLGGRTPDGKYAPSAEAAWDQLLGQGLRFHAVATDDTHNYLDFAKDKASPGKGWVSVRAAKLDAASILDALREGDFYCSTGVELADLKADARGLSLSLPDPSGYHYDTRHKTEFVGKGGEVLKTDYSMSPSYSFNGSELYVRARVSSSAGEWAWTQPVFRQ